MAPKQSRLAFIDFARSYGVFLALLSHALIATGAYEQLGDNAIIVRSVTRMATPMFVFMFGFMIEFVYVRKAKAADVDSVTRRILIRGFQCYLAFILTSFCAYVGGYKSATGFIGSLFFMSNSRFGNILMVYSVLLLIMPFLIRIRLKLGRYSLLAGLALLYVSFPFLYDLKSISFGIFDNLANVAFGIGPKKSGPSIWHSLSFVFAGMFVASSLANTHQREKKYFYYACFYLLILCAVMFNFLIDEGVQEAWIHFTSGHYRRLNLAGYFVIGTFTSAVIIMFLSLIISSTTKLNGWVSYPLTFGYSSLIAYTLGNCLLNLFGQHIYDSRPIPVISALLITVMVATKHIRKFPYVDLIDDTLNFRYTAKDNHP